MRSTYTWTDKKAREVRQDGAGNVGYNGVDGSQKDKVEKEGEELRSETRRCPLGHRHGVPVAPDGT